MGTINGFQDLVAWQKGMDLAALVYDMTKRFPSDERFGLTSQTRRSAVSIPCNVAEGYGRRTRRDYVRFLDVARGSANELQTQLMLAVRLGFVTKEQAALSLSLTLEEQRILKGLVNALEACGKPDVRASLNDRP